MEQVLIIGSGLAGLHTALSFNEDTRVLIVTNSKIRDCNSYLAQGGITTVSNGDKKLFIKDTLTAGENQNDLDAIEIVGDSSMKYLKNLIDLGVGFDREIDGKLKLTREAAHSISRIAYKGSETGKAIIDALIEELGRRKNIELLEETSLIDLVVEDNIAKGAWIKTGKDLLEVYAQKTVLATGGIGGLFSSTTNEPNIDGIALALAKKHSIKTRDIGYIQFHPTALDDNRSGRKFLLSEALRGEGALIRDSQGKRFIDELKPRNVVTEKVRQKLLEGRVYLDATTLDSEYLKKRFTGIYRECLERGYDITKDLLPIRPAQHYYMGGLAVDSYGRTSCTNLYAVGEASCTGLHGKNRLASNSLLEALVYSGRAAKDIEKQLNKSEERKDRKSIVRKNFQWNYREEAIKLLLEKRGDLKDELSIS